MAFPIGLAAAISEPNVTGCLTAASGPVNDLDAEQGANARVIVSVGRQRGVPPGGLAVALMTAMQESTLRNLPYGDRDSLGLFQQRPSTGWGTPAQVTDPAYAAAAFYGGPDSPTPNPGLLDVPGWQQMPPTVAAQAVQRSAYPSAYAKWESSATAWVSQILAPLPGSAACQSATGAAATVIATAARWLGTPYAWGGGNAGGPTEGFGRGAGTVGFDCSGLTVHAFASVGVTLPRTSRQQWNAPGERVRTMAELRPGDLIFFATDTSDPRTIHHVAISIGGYAMVEAPRTGEVVRVSEGVSESGYWSGQFIGGLRILH
jgi:cell wall-associated NlpC family hydrolase